MTTNNTSSSEQSNEKHQGLLQDYRSYLLYEFRVLKKTRAKPAQMPLYEKKILGWWNFLGDAHLNHGYWEALMKQTTAKTWRCSPLSRSQQVGKRLRIPFKPTSLQWTWKKLMFKAQTPFKWPQSSNLFPPRPLTVNSAKIGEIWKKNTSAVKRFTDPVRACFCLINPIGDQNGFNFFQDVARGEIADTRRTHRLKVAKYPRQIISKKHQSITEKWQHVPSRLSKFPGYSWVKLPSKRENYFTNLMKKYVLIFTKKCHN